MFIFSRYDGLWWMIRPLCWQCHCYVCYLPIPHSSVQGFPSCIKPALVSSISKSILTRTDLLEKVKMQSENLNNSTNNEWGNIHRTLLIFGLLCRYTGEDLSLQFVRCWAINEGLMTEGRIGMSYLKWLLDLP